MRENTLALKFSSLLSLVILIASCSVKVNNGVGASNGGGGSNPSKDEATFQEEFPKGGDEGAGPLSPSEPVVGSIGPGENSSIYAVNAGSLYKVDWSGQQSLVVDGMYSMDNLEIDGVTQKIFFNSYSGRVYQMNLDGSQKSRLTDLESMNVKNIALDQVNRKLYLGVGSQASGIFRCNLDGSNVEQIFTVSGTVYGMHVDQQNAKIYWSQDKAIHRAALDGTAHETIFTEPSYNIMGLAVDATNGHIYYSTWGTASLKRVDLDGQNSSTVAAYASNIGTQVRVDSVNQRVLWADRNTREIRSVNFDGSNHVQLHREDGYQTMRGLALHDATGEIYWSESNTSAIHKMSGAGTSKSVVHSALIMNISSFVYNPIDERIYFTDTKNLNLASTNKSGEDFQLLKSFAGAGYTIGTIALSVEDQELYLAMKPNYSALYWGKVKISDASTTVYSELSYSASGFDTALLVDDLRDMVYLADYKGGLRKYNKDGSDPVILVDANPWGPVNAAPSFAYDSLNDKIFWANPTENRAISTLSPVDGLVGTSTVLATAMVVDPLMESLYFFQPSGTLFSAYLDVSDWESVLSSSVFSNSKSMAIIPN